MNTVLYILISVAFLGLYILIKYIEHKSEQLQKARKALECPECHNKFDKGNYCSECGTPIWLGISKSEHGKCVECGQIICEGQDTEKFCSSCGSPLNTIYEEYSYIETMERFGVSTQQFEKKYREKVLIK